MIDFSFLAPYFGFFGSLVAAGFGAPIPEEIPVVVAGVWAANPDTVANYGVLRWIALPVCIVGVVLADLALYGIGRKFGTRLLEFKWAKRFVPPEKREKIEQNFDKYGIKILLFARLTPGIRAPMFVMSGVMKLPFHKFLIADGIYAIPGVSLLFFLGWGLGKQFLEVIEAFEQKVATIGPILLLLAILAFAGFLLYKFFKKPISDGEPPHLSTSKQPEVEGEQEESSEITTPINSPTPDQLKN